MKHLNLSIIFISVIALIFLSSQAIFTVDQTQQALVLQLGEPIGEVLKPGLHFKIPFIQNIVYLDARTLDYEARKADALTSDKKAIVLDNYARWKIIDPLAFYRTVRTIPRAQARLEDIIYSQLRVFIGRYTLTEVVSTKRSEIMAMVTKKTDDLTREYGIEIIDVRIKRTDLPPQNQRAIFGRMQAERERQAKQYRSEGQEEATKIKSMADRDKNIIMAEARQKASIMQGDGDAEATKIYAEALSKSPDFYEFRRSLDAYRKSLKDNTKILLPLESSFLKFLQNEKLNENKSN